MKWMKWKWLNETNEWHAWMNERMNEWIGECTKNEMKWMNGMNARNEWIERNERNSAWTNEMNVWVWSHWGCRVRGSTCLYYSWPIVPADMSADCVAKDWLQEHAFRLRDLMYAYVTTFVKPLGSTSQCITSNNLMRSLYVWRTSSEAKRGSQRDVLQLDGCPCGRTVCEVGCKSTKD